MFSKERYLVVFSIVTSLFSAGLGFIEKFIQSIHAVDLTIIFFSGIFILLVVLILLFFLAKEIISKFPSRKVRVKKRKSKRK